MRIDLSSKTLYKLKNQRNINKSSHQNKLSIRSFVEDDLIGKNSSQTSSTYNIDRNHKIIEEMSLKEKTKNFIESYDDLVLIITQNNLN